MVEDVFNVIQKQIGLVNVEFEKFLCMFFQVNIVFINLFLIMVDNVNQVIGVSNGMVLVIDFFVVVIGRFIGQVVIVSQ